jgi:hypothetical protein
VGETLWPWLCRQALPMVDRAGEHKAPCPNATRVLGEASAMAGMAVAGEGVRSRNGQSVKLAGNDANSESHGVRTGTNGAMPEVQMHAFTAGNGGAVMGGREISATARHGTDGADAGISADTGIVSTLGAGADGAGGNHALGNGAREGVRSSAGRRAKLVGSDMVGAVAGITATDANGVDVGGIITMIGDVASHSDTDDAGIIIIIGDVADAGIAGAVGVGMITAIGDRLWSRLTVSGLMNVHANGIIGMWACLLKHGNEARKEAAHT